MEIDYSLEERSRKRKRDSISDDFFVSAGIIYDEEVFNECSKHPRIVDRTSAVFSLIKSYDLLRNFTILKSQPATFEELCNFHSSDYIGYLEKINVMYTPDDEIDLEYGLGYDCPAIDGIYDFCRAIGGSSLSAARALSNGTVDIAINWCGGWHHAQRDEAEGFCYINDVALGILELRKTFENVLYFDLDIHHGNGVENCFAYTKRVMTVSFHLYEVGFYPGTGSENDVGNGNGKYYTVNIPLHSGACDATYIDIFDWVLSSILAKFTPDAIVVQCGADGLSGDPVGKGFNLSLKSLGHCVKSLLDLRKPTLILGGGGYHVANTARCWTYLSSIVTGTVLDSDIPENEFFSMYGPTFELSVSTSNRKDNNCESYIKLLKEKISLHIFGHYKPLLWTAHHYSAFERIYSKYVQDHKSILLPTINFWCNALHIIFLSIKI